MTFTKNLVVAAIMLSLLAACSENNHVQQTTTSSPTATVNSQSTSSASEEANALFDKLFKQGVARNPVMQTSLGIKTDYDKWNDISEANIMKELNFAKQNLVLINSIDVNTLDQQTKISHQLYKQKFENHIADHKWRFHNYPVNQMFGTHSRIPAFLINQHAITNSKDAEDYIARVKGANNLLMQLIEQLKLREDKGIIAPKFVFEHVLRDSQNILIGAPFDTSGNSTILTDFKDKIGKLTLSDKETERLMLGINEALITHFKPGYEALIAYLKLLATKADDRDGAWKFPDGAAFYKNALLRTTTTHLTPKEIHNLGLSEVKRIHDEMRVIMKKVNFDGNLKDFFKFMRDDPQFYYPATPEGKSRYISEAVALIDDMEARLDSLFLTKPKAALKVKAVEAFREKSAGKAFYERPAPDGSRPGIYYANLYDMASMPSYQMAALAYHEGIPGHHMQLAIKQELTGIPMFRKFGGYTAHTEGWGLYSEMIPKEIGLYQDPYSDFGRLAMELWRACRLVVDTGIHSQQWTREQGIQYYTHNTPNAVSDAVKMVERHIVMPSQATAYKIGMNKIIELRQHAKKELGEAFDIREYHDVILKNGPVPLNVLTDLVNRYIVEKSA